MCFFNYRWNNHPIIRSKNQVPTIIILDGRSAECGRKDDKYYNVIPPNIIEWK